MRFFLVKRLEIHGNRIFITSDTGVLVQSSRELEYARTLDFPLFELKERFVCIDEFTQSGDI